VLYPLGACRVWSRHSFLQLLLTGRPKAFKPGNPYVPAYPILSGMSRRRAHSGRQRRRARGERWHSGGVKCLVNFLLCCRCCQALWRIFSPRILWALRHMAPIGLAASCGVGIHRLQRPALRAGLPTRHPMLSASFDESWQACERRPPLSDGFFARPDSFTGRLHQHQGRSLTQHLNSAYASLRTAP
jgi:hypothetical protein